jgi:hypothetical protein
MMMRLRIAGPLEESDRRAKPHRRWHGAQKKANTPRRRKQKQTDIGNRAGRIF